MFSFHSCQLGRCVHHKYYWYSDWKSMWNRMEKKLKDIVRRPQIWKKISHLFWPLLSNVKKTFVTCTKNPIITNSEANSKLQCFSLTLSVFQIRIPHINIDKVFFSKNKAYTVWPQLILKKVRSWWQIPPQHQSTYLGGPESASIEIPPFRPKFP